MYYKTTHCHWNWKWLSSWFAWLSKKLLSAVPEKFPITLRLLIPYAFIITKIENNNNVRSISYPWYLTSQHMLYVIIILFPTSPWKHLISIYLYTICNCSSFSITKMNAFQCLNESHNNVFPTSLQNSLCKLSCL